MQKLLFTLAFLCSFNVLAAAPTLDDYLNAGIPAPSRAWSGADYTRTAQVLGEGKLALPRHADVAGDQIANRLVSLENLAFYRNKSLPIQNRFVDYLKLQEGANNLLKIYFARFSRGEPVLNEVVDMVAFSLHLSALGLDLVDEFLPTIPNDKNYETRMAGLKQMHGGVMTQFSGAQLTLTEENGFSTAERSAVLKAMAETLPTLKKAFTPDFRSELRKKLEADKERLKSENDSKLVDRMLEELKV